MNHFYFLKPFFLSLLNQIRILIYETSTAKLSKMNFINLEVRKFIMFKKLLKKHKVDLKLLKALQKKQKRKVCNYLQTDCAKSVSSNIALVTKLILKYNQRINKMRRKIYYDPNIFDV